MLKELFYLPGKNALATGAGQGTGKSIAMGLAEFEANVKNQYHSNHENCFFKKLII